MNILVLIVMTYLLHLRTITIIIAPKIAEITETIINVKAHPSSPAASENRKIKQCYTDCLMIVSEASSGRLEVIGFCSFRSPFLLSLIINCVRITQRKLDDY